MGSANHNQPRASSSRRMETTAFAGNSREPGRSSESDPRSNSGFREARRASYDPRGNTSIREDRRGSYDPRGNIEESDTYARDARRSSGYDPRGNADRNRYSNEPQQHQNQTRQVHEESFEMRRRPYQSSQSGQVSQKARFLPNTSRPSQVPYGRQMSKKAGSEVKTTEDIFKEALAKKQPLSNIPNQIFAKKKRLMQGNAQASVGETIVFHQFLPGTRWLYSLMIFGLQSSLGQRFSKALKELMGQVSVATFVF
eukprot:TRINITY_DN21052_c0_g1_i1.p1 TRINITY_DN21052_c0_g1~~TRINITY_DN21052_c0_g1_i1.p1  ORF type:complete len:263 (-),score=41.49 TRINITY_DN21052_c0_g1_i1:811-1575(-)